MAELRPLRQLFSQEAGTTLEDFLSRYAGAFLLCRIQSLPPSWLRLIRTPHFKLTIGSDEDCDLALEMDQTLDPKHATVAFHEGFRGFTVEDHGTNFGTRIDDEPVSRDRAHLLSDRQVVQVGGLVELQFYEAKTLWERMSQAGITRRHSGPRKAVKRPK